VSSAVSLPTVSSVSRPVAGAVHRNQIERPPVSPPCRGSPGSTVAPTLSPRQAPAPPMRTIASRRASFGGASRQSRRNSALSADATAIE
jgi:hypothetical protein